MNLFMLNFKTTYQTSALLKNVGKHAYSIAHNRGEAIY